MNRLTRLMVLMALALAAGACAGRTGPASTAPVPLPAPDADAVALVALAEQARQLVAKETPDAVLRQIDTDLTKTDFRFTDKAAAKEILVLVPAAGAPPEQWVIDVSTTTPLVGATGPGLDLPRLKAGPAQVVRAMAKQWAGCTPRGLTLYPEQGHLTWQAECTTPAGVVAGTMDGETGAFQPSAAPPALLPVTVTPAAPTITSTPATLTRIDLSEGLSLRQIRKDVFVVTHAFPWPANSLIVEMANSDLVLVGTPYTPAATTEVLAWIGQHFGERKMVAIDTGYHVDNLGGNSALIEAGIPVYGSDLTAQLLAERGEQSRQVILGMLPGAANARYYQAHAEIPYVAPSHLFPVAQGLKLSFGAEQVEVIYPGPSQAPDKVVVYFPSKKVLFGGCLILGGDQLGNIADADLRRWPEAVRQLKPFGAEVVVPGHGDRLDAGLIEHTLTLLLAAEPFVCQVSGPDVYLVFNAERHHIVDWDTFLALGFTQAQIRPCGASAAAPEGAPLTRLLKGSGDPVYWLEGGQRHHIPSMEQFRALGFREQDIAVVADSVLEIWPIGQPVFHLGPLPTIPNRPTATLWQALQSTPIPPPTLPPGTLRDALKAIHDPFKIDPAQGCFGLQSPYPEYHRGLQQMTALLLTDPRAQGLSYVDREALFKDVTGFDGVRFYPENLTAAEGAATLVVLRTNRGYNLGCGSRFASPDALHVVDWRGHIYDLGTVGTSTVVQWVADRWIVLFRTKLDSSSGPTPWTLWQIGMAGDGWARLAELEFSPPPYNFSPPPPLRFDVGYQMMIADLDYWWADDPCEFTAAFKAEYKHDTWQMRRTYQFSKNTYVLTSSEVLTFTVQRQDTGEAVALDWQAYCAGPVR